MTTEISKQPIQAVSFNGGLNGLTKGQENIMKLLVDSYNGNKPITKDDIIDTYCLTQLPTGSVTKYWMYADGEKHEWTETRDSWNVKARAITWFKQNLGSCIIKGKILAIPIIEL